MSESFDAMSGREAEAMKEAVVRDNVRLMDTAMMELLMTESFGGSAQTAVVDGEEYGLAAADALVNRLTGKIIAFKNSPTYAGREMEAPISFLVAADIRRARGFFRIVETRHGSRRNVTLPGSHRDDVLDTHALDVLQRSIDKWNAEHEEDITQP